MEKWLDRLLTLVHLLLALLNNHVEGLVRACKKPSTNAYSV